MTVSSVVRPRIIYDGDDTDVNFPITFPYNDDETTVKVVHIAANGTETNWVNGGGGATGYTIVAAEVVANTAPATGAYLMIYRNTLQKQLTDMMPNHRFSADTEEEMFDILTLMIQELQDQIDRCVHIPLSSSITEVTSITKAQLDTIQAL
jgi:hypothetical protein